MNFLRNMSEKKRSKVAVITYLCLTALLVLSFVTTTLATSTTVFAKSYGGPTATGPSNNVIIMNAPGGSGSYTSMSDIDENGEKNVRLTAMAKTGYVFDHWEINGSYRTDGSLNDEVIDIIISSDITATPYFVAGSSKPTQPSGSPSENPTDPVSENDSTNVKYSVEPTYIVSIPATVTLGNTATISSDGVVVEKGKQVEVALASTSENDNSFKLKSAEGAEIEYTIENNGSAVSLNDKVLIVNPDDASTGSSTLSFVAPSGVTYAGRYTGTVTFNVAVANTEGTQTPVETPTATAPPEGVE